MPGPHEDIFSTYDSEAPIATELRRLYHNAKSASQDGRLKSLLITSSNRGEGKSTTTSYLGLTIAQFPRKKILIVDADFRLPRIHSMFGVRNDYGLHECLKDNVDPMKVVTKTQLENLHVITAGGRTRSPSRLFESEQLSDVLAKLTFYYDMVLVDSAPVLAVSDTMFLCSVVDAVLFVVMAGVTPKEVAIRAKNQLVDSGANILGAIVNNAAEILPYYYDSKYYQYEP